MKSGRQHRAQRPGACSLSPHIALHEVAVPHLTACRERVAACPAVQVAMQIEGLLK
ncbi:hypothetical protein [Acidovorax soli]|uniref:hypothetical protein n=1 Tax=Acidovorax TaxID=12916 RepID=UPI0026EAC5F8|nr:hypothetical protein [Acidovorax soli]MCM2347423.1 hypothetical protein [Acidovorax soli]